MKRIFIYLLLMFLSVCVFASTEETQMWGAKQNRDGLHTRFNRCIAEGVRVSADLRLLNTEQGPTLKQCWHRENWRPSLSVMYLLPADYLINWRFGGSIGYHSYRVAGEQNPAHLDKYYRYHSVNAEVFAGIEIYPIRSAGLYAVVGVSAFASMVFTPDTVIPTTFPTDKYSFSTDKIVSGSMLIEGREQFVNPRYNRSFHVVPMGVIGLGYTWRPKKVKRMMINVEASMHLSLFTTREYNIAGAAPNRNDRERVLLGYNLNRKEFQSPEGFGALTLGFTYTLATKRTTSKRAKFY